MKVKLIVLMNILFISTLNTIAVRAMKNVFVTGGNQVRWGAQLHVPYRYLSWLRPSTSWHTSAV